MNELKDEPLGIQQIIDRNRWPKDEPEGINKALAKQRAVDFLHRAQVALASAESALCAQLIDHQRGEQLMIEYQQGVKRLIVEVSQL